MKDADRAINALRGLGDVGEQALAKLTTSAPRAGAAFEASTATVTRSSGQMRAAIGQVGFQVQDLVVQLQAGTPVLTAFVQQGSQIAGAFGPVGAIIGTVGSVLGIAAGALLGFNREAEAAKPVLDGVVKSFGAASQEADKYAKALEGATGAQRAFAQAAAARDLGTARGDVGAATGDIVQAVIDQFREQNPGRYSELRPRIRDLSASLRTAISAGKTDEVQKLLNDSGILDTPDGFALAQRALELATTIQTLEGVASGEAGVRAAVSSGLPPGGMRTGFYGGGSGGGRTSGNPAAPAGVPPARTASSAATLADQARRDAEQIARAREEAAARLQAGQIALYEAQAEETGKAYAAKWNESLAAEQQANAQAQVDILAEPARQAAREIQNALAGAIYDGLNGQIKTIGDFFTTFKNIALQTVSQVAAAAILTPGAIFGGGAAVPAAGGVAEAGGAGGGGIGALLGLGGLLGGGGATLAEAFPSLFGAGGASLTALGGGGAGALAGFGGASLAGIAGSAGLGFLGGSLIAPALGLNGLGGGIGGGLGAGLGFVVGGPLGALVGGGLGTVGGGFLGNAFGLGGDGSAERNNNFQYDIDLASGDTSGSNTKPDQRNVDIVQQLTGRVQGLLEALRDMGGTTTGSLNIQSGNRSGLTLDGVRYDNAEDLQLDAFRQIVLATTGLDPRVATAAGRSQATDAQEFIGDLQFAENFDRLTRTTGDLTFAAEELIKGFEEAAAKAVELGLSVEELTTAQDEQLREQARDIQMGFRAQVESAFGYVDSLTAFRDQLRLGRGSGRQQLGTARSQFEEIAAAAQAGDLDAIDRLQGAASSYLAAGQNVYASGQGFQQIRQTVEAVLNAVIGQGRNAERDLLAGIAEDQNTVADLTARFTKLQEDVLAAVKTLNTTMQRSLAT